MSSTKPTERVERILACTFELTREAIVLTDLRGIAFHGSAAAERLLGVGKGFFARRPLINVVARQDTRLFRAWVVDLAHTPAGTARSRSVRLRSRAGHVFAASIEVTRLALPQGDALHWRLEERAQHHPTPKSESDLPVNRAGGSSGLHL